MTGLFVGSFDPFTIGHEAIVRRALPLFDRLVIGIGVNPAKQCSQPASLRRDAIARLYAGDGRVEVVEYTGLTAELAREVGAQFIVKGVRTADDFDYERQQADFNRARSGVETLLLMAEPELRNVSSTLVRAMRKEGKDTRHLVPVEAVGERFENLKTDDQ
ncbi:MAG: pantetheine-phosphate adenylyltransferase [Prevotella sp.]|nr:pantetheine-phosphate adenylyltransferase [Prevotella sp.]